jgi:PAP2 superfamily
MRTSRSRRPLLVGEVLVVLLLVFVYDRIRDVATTRADIALSNGRDVLTVERWLHIDVERWLNALMSSHHGWEAAASWYYQLMHLTVTLLVLLWVYWRRVEDYRPARNALVGINAFGLLVFWVLPVAPPRLIPGAGFIDSAVVSGVADKATAVSPDLYAAMPSLHVAWATWVALQVLLTTSNGWARRLGVGHLAVTCVVVVLTANHYVLDLVAGAVLAAVVVRVSRRRIPVEVWFRHITTARDRSAGRARPSPSPSQQPPSHAEDVDQRR